MGVRVKIVWFLEIKTHRMRTGRSHSELAIARESVTITGVCAETQRQGRGVERFIVENRDGK